MVKNMFLPTILLRFGRKGLIDCNDRPINEHLICKTNSIGYLKNDFIDYNIKSLFEWIKKHNFYSEKEAEVLFENNKTKYNFFGIQYKRKRWIRVNIWNRLLLVIRFSLYFLYRYVFRLGFLDAKEAFIYYFLHAFIYKILIYFKYLEKNGGNSEEKKYFIFAKQNITL